MYTQEEPNMLAEDYNNLTAYAKAKYEGQVLSNWGPSSDVSQEEFLRKQIYNLEPNWKSRQSVFNYHSCSKEQWAALDSGDKTYDQGRRE